MTLPTLSVLIPNYNHARYLTGVLTEVLAQSYRPVEVVVMDDGSRDNSVEVVEEFVRRHPLVRLIRNERNLGVVPCINRLMRLAVGDYLYFLAADDNVRPGFFEKSIRLLAEYPQAGICSTLTVRITEAGEIDGICPTPVISDRPCYVSPAEARKLLCRIGFWVPGNATIYRRDALLAEG